MIAVIGIRLNLGKGQLPEAFEAEERSVPGLGDLLHIVSGRTLLGIVRERSSDRLSDPSSAATQQVPSNWWHMERRGNCESAAQGSGAYSHQHTAVRRDFKDLLLQGGSSPATASLGRAQQWDPTLSSSAAPHKDRGVQSSSQLPSDCSESAEDAAEAAARRAEGSEQREPQSAISGRELNGAGWQSLELLLQDELVAVAVRQRETCTSAAPPQQQRSFTGAQSSAAQGDSTRCPSEAYGRSGGLQHASGIGKREQKREQYASQKRMGRGGVISIYTADGGLLCEVANGQLRGGQLDDRLRFSVISTATPLVRHLYFVAETGVMQSNPYRGNYAS